MKKKNFEIDFADVVEITFSYNNWNGTVTEWQEAFFKLLSWKNTFEVPFELDIKDGAKHVPFLSITVSEHEAGDVAELLDGYGYQIEDQNVIHQFAVLINAEFDDAVDRYFVYEE